MSGRAVLESRDESSLGRGLWATKRKAKVLSGRSAIYFCKCARCNLAVRNVCVDFAVHCSFALNIGLAMLSIVEHGGASACGGNPARKSLVLLRSFVSARASLAGFRAPQVAGIGWDMAGVTRKTKKPARTGEDVVYGFGATPLGSILTAVSPRGVCALLFGEQEKKLTRELREIFPQAQPASAGALNAALEAACDIAAQPWRPFALSLDIQGTDFQKKVWAALQDIPAGVTVSYAEMAQRIGSPKALRAVAGACAANHLAIVVPCHRVLRLNGSLSGYRWGRERKLRLIEMEKIAAPASILTATVD
jgi:O-6-methylguanine DNA methyltransferase